MSTERSKSVVVGVDQSAGARAALEWAATEAALRGAPLLIATSWSGPDYQVPEEYEPDVAAPVYRTAAQFLAHAAADMRNLHPGLDVDTALMPEAPVEGLIRLARDAGLAVVGRRGLNTFQRMLLGSVSRRLVAHSPVPVVVVPETPPMTTFQAPVVVGVAREVTEPLEFAFVEAQTRDASLIAVRAWANANPYVTASPEAVAEIQADESGELRSLVDVIHRRHPSVKVSTRVEFGTPEVALIEAAERASLVVLGRHRRHARFGLPLGRVPHRVLHLSELPVAVVPN